MLAENQDAECDRDRRVDVGDDGGTGGPASAISAKKPRNAIAVQTHGQRRERAMTFGPARLTAR